MTERVPRKITKGYALGLLAADAFFAVALVVVSWGLMSLWLSISPVTSNVSNLTAPAIVIVCIALLVFFLWRELISLLKGHRPALVLAIIIPGLAYLTWSLLGTAFSMHLSDTWLSPFALVLAVSWLIALLAFWGILLRKLYSGKGRPLWPWEKKDLDDGPDWFRDGMP